MSVSALSCSQVFQPGCPPKCCNFNFVRNKDRSLSETVSGSVYIKDDEATLRGKFFALSIVQSIAGLVRLAFRITCLVTGDFFWAGYNIAKIELQNQRKEWSASRGLNRDRVSIPPELSGNFSTRVMSKSLCQLAKNVVKIVTYPFAIVLMEGIALYGLIQPVLSRTLFGLTENLWARDKIFISRYEKHEVGNRFSDYTAPCMQPDGVISKKGMHYDSNSNDVEEVFHLIMSKIYEKKLFYSDDGIAKINKNIRDAFSPQDEKSVSVILNKLKEGKALLENALALHDEFIEQQINVANGVSDTLEIKYEALCDAMDLFNKWTENLKLPPDNQAQQVEQKEQKLEQKEQKRKD